MSLSNEQQRQHEAERMARRAMYAARLHICDKSRVVSHTGFLTPSGQVVYARK